MYNLRDRAKQSGPRRRGRSLHHGDDPERNSSRSKSESRKSPGRSTSRARSRSRGRSPARRNLKSKSSAKLRNIEKIQKSFELKIERFDLEEMNKKYSSNMASSTSKTSRSPTPVSDVEGTEESASVLQQHKFPLESRLLHESAENDEASEVSFSIESSSSRSHRRSLESDIPSDVLYKEPTPIIMQQQPTRENFRKMYYHSGNVPIEFGGCLGCFALMILLPLSILGVHKLSMILCWCYDAIDWLYQLNGNDVKLCNIFELINWNDLKANNFFDLEVVVIYLATMVYLTVLSLVPVGKKVQSLPDKVGLYYYRCNGFYICLLAVATLASLHYYGYPVTIVYEKYDKFLMTAIWFGISLAVLLFICATRAPPVALNLYGTTYNVLYDLWMGRELNPRFGKLDVKTTLMKNTLIINVLLYIVLVLKKLDNDEEWDIAFYFTTFLQLFYALQCLWLEETRISSFYVLYEGVGYLLVLGSCIYPFFTTISPKYLLEHRQEYSLLGVCYSILISCLGYYIYFISNVQKHKFRMNILNLFKDIPAIKTLRGKNLMIAGWWGFVRHPNYLGDIILHWAWIGCCGFDDWFPYVVPVFTTLLLLHRAKRVETRCKHRYTLSYDKYCDIVKAMVFPKLF